VPRLRRLNGSKAAPGDGRGLSHSGHGRKSAPKADAAGKEPPSRRSDGSRLIALWKPYGVLSQFTGAPADETLAAFGLPKGVYPVGRLDKDSEGLLLLSDDGALIHRLLDPGHGHPRTYWAQVERVPDEDSLQALRDGVVLKDGPTRPAAARLLAEPPPLPPRDPPIRYRKSVPDAWVELVLTEGRNRQVRRMTAAVGHPTLRLVRAAVGELRLPELGLAPGEWREVDRSLPEVS